MGARKVTVALPLKPLFTNVMPKKISDMAMEKVLAISNRLSKFQSTLQIAHYAQGSIIDYCHALYKAVLQIGKLPEEFIQEEVDGYLLLMINRKPQPAESQFKHFIYGIKCYLNAMGFPQLAGLAFPKICTISPKTLQALRCYRKQYPSMNLVFKSSGADKPINNGYIRKLLKHGLQKSVAMTMIYLHVAKLETRKCIYIIHALKASAIRE